MQTAESEPWETDVLSCQAAEMGETEGNTGRQLWARSFLVQMLDKSTYWLYHIMDMNNF